MSTPETSDRPYDLFVSYAHVDDRGEHRGKVTAMVDAIRADYRRVAGAELNVFFDVGEIRSMDDWEVRILRGLRQSKMMVAVLSPAYFASDYCRKEWEIYVETELAHALPGEGIAPIYVLSHPAYDGGSEDEHLKHWLHDLRKRQYIDWRPFWPEGAEALGRADARRRLEALPGQIADRLRRAAVRDAAPNTVPLPSTHFVGRRDELHAVRRQLVSDHVGAITALHGIPGIGKTMLAFAYAWGYGYEYPGGRFLVPAAGLADLAAGVVALAEPLRLALTDEERRRPDVTLAKVKAALEGGPAALLVLDNVDDPALLEPQARERALPRGNHIHVLVTTRVAPKRLPRIHCVPLDALEPADGLALLQSFRPAADSAEDDEWKAALEVVRRLAGHALALEVVGVFLRENPGTSYRAFAESLARDGVGVLDAVGGEVPGQLEWHAESCVGRLLQPTLTGLSDAERRAVEYAAQLPPDEIPLSWLRTLLLADMPDLQQRGLIDPVAKAFTRLERLRLLVPLTRERGAASAPASGEKVGPRLARMHRLVQDIVTAGLSAEAAAERTARVKAHALVRAKEIRAAWGRTDLDWELPALRDMALRLLQADDWDGALLTNRIDTPLRHVGRLLDVRLLWQRAIVVEQKRCEAAPENADYASDLSASCGKLGDLHCDLGEPAHAREYYERARALAERLAALAPENADCARNLSTSYERLGDLHLSAGKLAHAREYYEPALAARERLAALAPENADYARDLTLRYAKLSDFHRDLCELARAREYYERALAARERLAALAPENADWQRDLSSISYAGRGDLHRALGELARAREYYERDLVLAERLAALAPENTDYAHGLYISCRQLGDLHRDLSEPARAREYYERTLAVAERLAAMAPKNADYADGLSIIRNALGDLHRALGEPARAREYYERALGTLERLVALAPENARYASALSIICNTLGDLNHAMGEPTRAREYYERALEMRERLAAQAPEDAGGYAHGLSVSCNKLGDLHRDLREPARAREYYERALEMDERLVAQAPENTGYARDLSHSRIKLANLRLDVARLALSEPIRAREYYERNLVIAERLAAREPENADYADGLSNNCRVLGDLHRALGEPARAHEYYKRAMETAEWATAQAPKNAGYARDLSVSCNKLGDLLLDLGEPARARGYYERALETRERLAALAPENADWQRDLYVSYWRMAALSANLKDRDAEKWWRRAHDVLQDMVDRGLFVSPKDRRVLDLLKAKLGL